MPQPHLLPSAADLANFAMILVVAALTVGIGFLAGARRLETAFFSGWGLACLIFVAAGTWFSVDLAGAAALSGALGLLGWMRWLVWPPAGRSNGDQLAWRVLLLGLPFIILILGMADIAWDDFAFWLPDLLYLCTTHHFPTLAQPAVASAMAAYPYGLALPGFAVHLLGSRQVETVALVWNLLAMLAAGAAFTNVLARRMRSAAYPTTTAALWGVAALGVLLEGMANPTFIAKITLANMGDSASGAGLGLLCALLFEWCSERPNPRKGTGILVEISLTCCALVFLRQANPALIGLLFLSAAAALALFDNRVLLPTLTRLFATLLPPLFIWYSWASYADREIPHGRHYLLPWGKWHWSVFDSTLASAGHVLIVKSGFTLMTIALGTIVARAIIGTRRGIARSSFAAMEPAAAVGATAAAGLAIGNIFFLLFCYLATSFYPDEARQAIAFWRFLSQTGQSLMIGFACVVPVAWLAAGFRRTWLTWALPAVAFLLPIGAVSTYRDDLTSPVPRLRAIADAMDQVLPAGKSIALLDISGNGFATLVVKYQLRAVEQDPRPISVYAAPHGMSLAETRGLNLPADAYVWLAEGSPAFAAIFGQGTNTGCSYLFAGDASAYHLIRDWDIGKHGWSTRTFGGGTATKPGCSS